MRTDRQRARDLIRIYYENLVETTIDVNIEYFFGFLLGIVRAFYEADTITYNDWKRYESFFNSVYKKKEELKRDAAGN